MPIAAADLPHDKALTGKVLLALSKKGSGSLLGSKSATVNNLAGIAFQFPPVIKSDNKGGNWKEFDIRNAEPMAIYMGGKAREIDLTWSYIVNGQTMGSDGFSWKTSTVATQVKLLRGYFYNTIGADMVVKFVAYDVVGSSGGDSDFWTFRADGISVSHSETLITDVNGTYPLRTDLSLKLKFLTDLSRFGADGLQGNDKTISDQQAKMLIPSAKPLPDTLKWY